MQLSHADSMVSQDILIKLIQGKLQPSFELLFINYNLISLLKKVIRLKILETSNELESISWDIELLTDLCQLKAFKN